MTDASPATAPKRHRRLIRRRRPRVRGPSFNRMVPNIMTMLGLCAGLTGMRMGLEGRFGEAATALLIAACIDGLDGRIARLLRGTSRFGAEFDSLSDFLCFGVAPSFVLYLWALKEGGRFGYVPCIMFTVCMALRLARFNASLDDVEQPKYASNFFTGVPAPAGAGLAMFPLFLGLEAHKLGWDSLYEIARDPLMPALTLSGTAFLLVSTLPVWSFKNFKVPAPFVLPVMLGIGGYAAVFVADPWGALAGAGIIYLLLLPLSRRSFHHLKKEAEALQQEEDPADLPAA
ncbi:MULTISPECIES: phosphatidylcholine/phosphatidylserine synthase [Novacetimonas]|uniref:Phosphatidylcholine/phosphatidylserine synthase n=1 Tax=Novacetimonas hansenii TaxID=436 RepID=A0AAW5EUH2_NOVHA|nr:phosphatidylcholine/phosphatidylserine synthase [Novacetimonas hansenii]MBL7235459.1 phosphatidylcholine/phosphatidylserine synthase [Novacetimonas hansenii]MCJ8354446.1 phosphatidylcholine/phosphatidylserine synthase [Novacetimonas hansenii]PYD72651.1 CDP-diacylglycerol--serine O-phosphatidyltransferase [Novacetimonas hansenii]WEQ58985.1 phosphatidylcholine/phosphatidylserine synthase [Novacetimonas hansenii]